MIKIDLKKQIKRLLSIDSQQGARPCDMVRRGRHLRVVHTGDLHIRGGGRGGGGRGGGGRGGDSSGGGGQHGRHHRLAHGRHHRVVDHHGTAQQQILRGHL